MTACVVENEQIVLVNTLILFVCLFIFASWFCFVYAVILRQCLTGVAVVGLELSAYLAYLKLCGSLQSLPLSVLELQAFITISDHFWLSIFA